MSTLATCVEIMGLELQLDEPQSNTQHLNLILPNKYWSFWFDIQYKKSKFLLHGKISTNVTDFFTFFTWQGRETFVPWVVYKYYNKLEV